MLWRVRQEKKRPILCKITGGGTEQIKQTQPTTGAPPRGNSTSAREVGAPNSRTPKSLVGGGGCLCLSDVSRPSPNSSLHRMGLRPLQVGVALEMPWLAGETKRQAERWALLEVPRSKEPNLGPTNQGQSHGPRCRNDQWFMR